MSTVSTPTATSVSSGLREQWKNPSDILSVLLIVGADVVKSALAQFNGQSFKPVPFSFGWVAYSYTYLLTTVGGLKSMPEAEFPCVLINCKSGMVYDRTSWLLGRVMDTYEDVWMPEEVKTAKSERWAEWEAIERTRNEDFGSLPVKRIGTKGFTVAVFSPSETMGSQQGVSRKDSVVRFGIATTVLQLGVAAVPCGLYQEWEILVITAVGTLLAWLMGFLQERFTATRKGTKKSFVITKGTGSGQAILILGNGHGLDLEDLANEVSYRGSKTRYRLSIVVALLLVILWTALLITTSGMQSNTWYLVCIGGIGMLQNIFIAGARRDPTAYGLYLAYEDVISNSKTMATLKELEEKYPRAGQHLLPVMFPTTLRPDELAWWADAEQEAERKERLARDQEWRERAEKRREQEKEEADQRAIEQARANQEQEDLIQHLRKDPPQRVATISAIV